MISKMILASDSLGCSEEVITIAAILSIQVDLIFLMFLLNAILRLFIYFSRMFMLNIFSLIYTVNLGFSQGIWKGTG